MAITSPAWHTAGLPLLLERRDLPDDLVRAALADLTAGSFDEAEAAALLIALRMKGESASEIAAAVEALRGSMIRLEPPTRPVLDTCGTGGDGTGTFNISTATALVVAGTSACRSSSTATGRSPAGAAAPTSSRPRGTGRIRPGVGPAVSGRTWLRVLLRPALSPGPGQGRSTASQARGADDLQSSRPAANPAGAEHQLLGVGRRDLLDPMAGAIARLGTRGAFLVCGQGRAGRSQPCGPTLVRQVRDGKVESLEWTPADFGLEPVSVSDLTC